MKKQLLALLVLLSAWITSGVDYEEQFRLRQKYGQHLLLPRGVQMYWDVDKVIKFEGGKSNVTVIHCNKCIYVDLIDNDAAGEADISYTFKKTPEGNIYLSWYTIEWKITDKEEWERFQPYLKAKKRLLTKTYGKPEEMPHSKVIDWCVWKHKYVAIDLQTVMIKKHFLYALVKMCIGFGNSKIKRNFVKYIDMRSE